MIAKCVRRCWDGKKARRYYPGDQDDINKTDPIAKFFQFEEETEVEAKAKSRVVPQNVKKEKE
jgi:hypothetical protein